MKIVLGSTSGTKKEILDKALKSLVKGRYEIVSVNVDSEISDQPLSENETINGATNRARSAFKKVPGADFAVGLEGGLNKANGTSYFLVCGAAIVDSNQKTYIGLGGQLELPKEVSNRIKNNEQFGEVIREYKAKNKTDQNASHLIDSLISREEPFIQAINNAYLSYKNKKHY